MLPRPDSLVVLPTGGAKSLGYLAPAVSRGGTTVVVSPLIALMKDQVDRLLQCGVAAARLDSSLSPGERRDVDRKLRAGNVIAFPVGEEGAHQVRNDSDAVARFALPSSWAGAGYVAVRPDSNPALIVGPAFTQLVPPHPSLASGACVP